MFPHPGLDRGNDLFDPFFQSGQFLPRGGGTFAQGDANILDQIKFWPVCMTETAIPAMILILY